MISDWLARWWGRRMIPEERLLVQGVFPRNWGYDPKPPYTVQLFREGGVIAQHQIPDLLKAIRVWDEECDDHLVEGVYAEVIDSRRTIVASVAMSSEALDVCGPIGYRCGVRVAYQAMEKLGVANPVDLAIWESSARSEIP